MTKVYDDATGIYLGLWFEDRGHIVAENWLGRSKRCLDRAEARWWIGHVAEQTGRLLPELAVAA
jgi:hypothetical protein